MFNQAPRPESYIIVSCVMIVLFCTHAAFLANNWITMSGIWWLIASALIILFRFVTRD